MFAYTLFSQDLLCTVTARDQAGRILAEAELPLDVMELGTQEFLPMVAPAGKKGRIERYRPFWLRICTPQTVPARRLGRRA